MAPYRRLGLVVLAVIAAAGLRAASAATAAALQPSVADEMVMGSPKAPVTLIEYASASCPHCARMNNDVIPELKKAYIDTGKVRYVFREILTPPQDFAGTAFLIARCAGPAQYFPILDDVYHQQTAIYNSGDLPGGLIKIAKAHGLTEAQLGACTDGEPVKALNARLAKADKDGFDSTPIFVIGPTSVETTKPMADFVKVATRIDGEKPLEVLEAAIDPMLAK